MGDRQFVLGKTRHRDDDAVRIFAKFEDVIGRPIVSVGAGVFEQIEDPVEADARAVERRKVEVVLITTSASSTRAREEGRSSRRASRCLTQKALVRSCFCLSYELDKLAGDVVQLLQIVQNGVQRFQAQSQR